MDIGIDPIENGSMCFITKSGITFRRFDRDRRYISRTLEKAISSTSTYDGGLSSPVRVCVRGFNMIKVADAYSEKMLARALLLERTVSIVQGKMVPYSVEHITDVAKSLGIKEEYIAQPLNRKMIAAQVSGMKPGIFSKVNEVAIPFHAVSAMMAIYCSRNHNEKFMFY